jgi:hypothetical protein
MEKQRRRKPFGSLAVLAIVCMLLFLGCFIPLGLPFFLPEPQWILENHIVNDDHSPLAELNCLPFGGPENASEMIYWRDIPTDAAYTSPFYNSKTTKYLTFEPDKGGWNNVRMNLETVIVMAHAMGRTLVMVCLNMSCCRIFNSLFTLLSPAPGTGILFTRKPKRKEFYHIGHFPATLTRKP